MYKQAIKYLTLLLVFAPVLEGFAQDAATGEQSASIVIAPKNISVNLQKVEKISLSKDTETKNYAVTRNTLIEHPINLAPVKKTKNESAFNIKELPATLVSSFRNNIRFGGFWEKWAIINFSPSVFVSPFDFINIYANQQISYFIPVTEIKDQMKNLCIQGAAILAIDNAFKYFINSDELIPAITNFALKNIVLTIVNKSLSKKRGNEVYQYNSFYYSMSIRF